MLYSRTGDDGTTSLYTHARISKGSLVCQALGSCDELNAWLGLCTVHANAFQGQVIEKVQQALFIVQAEIAGAGHALDANRVMELEEIINQIERQFPPITSFIVPGGTEFSALCDYARTLARRSERSIIAAENAEELVVSAYTKAYVNRLSSFLFALARLANHRAGVDERAPTYLKHDPPGI